MFITNSVHIHSLLLYRYQLYERLPYSMYSSRQYVPCNINYIIICTRHALSTPSYNFCILIKRAFPSKYRTEHRHLMGAYSRSQFNFILTIRIINLTYHTRGTLAYIDGCSIFIDFFSSNFYHHAQNIFVYFCLLVLFVRRKIATLLVYWTI